MCCLWTPPSMLGILSGVSMCLGVMAMFRIPGDSPMAHVAVLSLSAGLLGSLQRCPFLIISSPAGEHAAAQGREGCLCSLLGQTAQTIFSNSYQNGNLLPSVSPAEENSFYLQG